MTVIDNWLGWDQIVDAYPTHQTGCAPMLLEETVPVHTNDLTRPCERKHKEMLEIGPRPFL